MAVENLNKCIPGLMTITNIWFLDIQSKNEVVKILILRIRNSTNIKIYNNLFLNKVMLIPIITNGCSNGFLQIQSANLQKLTENQKFNFDHFRDDIKYAERIIKNNYKIKLSEWQIQRLTQKIEIRRRFSYAETMTLQHRPFFCGHQIAPLFLGLQFLHQTLNLLHYDLSFANIMVNTETKTLCLIDFGDAKPMKHNNQQEYRVTASLKSSGFQTPVMVFKTVSFRSEIEILICFALQFLGI